jgi:hypothetical protein
VGGIVLCHQNDAGGAFVQAVHYAGTQHIAALRKRLAPAKQRADQRAAGIARAGVHGHPRGLVDRQDIVIFVENIQRYRLRFDSQRGSMPNLDANVFTPAQAMRALRRASVDKHQPGGDELLHTGAADVRKPRCDALIQAFAGLSFRNYEFMKRRFAALVHEEIVAAPSAAYSWRCTTFRERYRLRSHTRYSIIVDTATNFRVWSPKVSGENIALRVTKLLKSK